MKRQSAKSSLSIDRAQPLTYELMPNVAHSSLTWVAVFVAVSAGAERPLWVVSSLSRMTVNDHSRSSRWPCKTSARILQQLNQPAHCLVDVSRGDDLDFKVIATELMASPACLLNDYLFITMGLAVWCTKSQRIFSGVRNINPEAFSN